jgi:hypothetical protein
MAEGTRAGVCGQSLGRRLSISLGKQVEVYAILAFAKFKLRIGQRYVLVFALVSMWL